MSIFQLLCAMLISSFSALSADDSQTPSADVVIVIGAAGTDEYGALFQAWADRWIAAAEQGGAQITTIGDGKTGEATDRDRLQQALAKAADDSQKPLWLVLIGHGTFDRKDAQFNLRGPDVSAAELGEWMKPVTRPMALIDCSASSAPFLTALSAEKRVVVTATKTGGEENFARFGEFLAAAIDDPEADLDKDDQTSLWEAFLAASRRTAEFYAADGRLQTEHALLDDNGDKQGTRADIFQGLQLQENVESAGTLDGILAHQWHLKSSPRDAGLSPDIRRRRDELELKIVKLRQQKQKIDADEYYRQLETLLVELARWNRETTTPK